MLYLCLFTQINLQHVFKTSAFGTYGCCDSCTLLVNGFVNLCVVPFCAKRLSSKLKGVSRPNANKKQNIAITSFVFG